MLQVAMFVERNIDGQWFPAELLIVDNSYGVVTLKYVDDDNIEEMVPIDEVRVPLRGSSNSSSSPQVDKKKTLPKPLAGLIYDDCEERQNHIPRSVVHMNEDDADTGGTSHFLLLCLLGFSSAL
jgi:hypothetical protein